MYLNGTGATKLGGPAAQSHALGAHHARHQLGSGLACAAARLRRRARRRHRRRPGLDGQQRHRLWPGQTSMQAGGQRAGRKIHYEYEDIQAIRAEVPIIRAVSAESTADFGFKTGTRVVSIQTRGVEFPYSSHAQDPGCGGPQHRRRRVRQPQACRRARDTQPRSASFKGRPPSVRPSSFKDAASKSSASWTSRSRTPCTKAPTTSRPSSPTKCSTN